MKRPTAAPRARMSDAQHAAVSRELVRLTLQGGDRPELLGWQREQLASASRRKSRQR